MCFLMAPHGLHVDMLIMPMLLSDIGLWGGSWFETTTINLEWCAMNYDDGTTEIVLRALDEDRGRGDVTSSFLLNEDCSVQGHIVAREDCVVSGLSVAEEVFRQTGAHPIPTSVRDGDTVHSGDCVLEVEGQAHALLGGERVALNFLQHLSGIATFTRSFVDKLDGVPARVVDTRKTIPGLRLVEKRAVRDGGGANHRFGLDDGILVKDNHLAAASKLGLSVGDLVADLRARTHHLLRIEVEVQKIDQISEVIAAGVDAILLDNMCLDTLRQAVTVTRSVAGGDRIILEASGNVSLDTVRDVAETGVDLISVGALTHSARAVDLSMEIET